MKQEDAARLVNELFETSGPFLLRYAAHQAKSPTVADDLVQEAFLALYRELREGKRIDNPKAWMFAVVRNQIRKRARNQLRCAEDLMSDALLDLMPAHPSWPDVESDTASPPPLDLSILSIREGEALCLRLESLKYREIAERLGISSKSVCTLLARALKKLRMVSGSHLPETVSANSLTGE
ncbi:MAG: RNA polymerase sigma factor [Bryobacterales bacterium]|nr:RNA polymerase sigma factor [Bryobacterales bacterium]